eukprot:1483813-Rhodomonas_salina.1
MDGCCVAGQDSFSRTASVKAEADRQPARSSTPSHMGLPTTLSREVVRHGEVTVLVIVVRL